MSVKINSFGGPLVWFFRRHFSSITSRMMLSFVAYKRSKVTQKYVNWFLEQKETPLFQNVMLETVNRCNGKCAFCPANVKDEKRPFQKMDEGVFNNVIQQLKKLDWHGKLFMCVNNEPFMDKRILDFSRYAKRELRDIKIVMISNGTLISIGMLDEMVGVVDQITINDYSEQYKLSSHIRKLYQHIKKKPEKFRNMQIVINRRYAKEILATRAGAAPNKPTKKVNINIPCLYPFTDLIVFPEGKVGICCNDCFEVTDFGNVMQDGIEKIWNNPSFRGVREAMRNGRKYPFCRECDVMDAGERENEIKKLMQLTGVQGEKDHGEIS